MRTPIIMEKYEERTGSQLEYPTANRFDSPKGDLEHIKALQYVDMENRFAYKGDNSDGKIDWNVRKLFTAAFLAMIYTGSQIPLYFVGGALTFIVKDLGTTVGQGWLPTANTLTIAAVAPFVGYLQDMFGKRYIAIFGAMLLCLGCVLLGTAHIFGQAVAGMSIAGAGAAIGELTGLAGLAETVPVKYRGYSLAVLTAFVLPFIPYVLYSQLLSTYATWRWVAWISLIYNGIAAIGLAATYFPHAHVRAQGFTKMEVLKRIDFLGAFLSITGLTLFLVALQAGGYTHPWNSPYVLCTLLIGLALILAWILWEWKGTKHPMVPMELFKGQRVVALAYTVAFVAGMNFFSFLIFWPLMTSTVWTPNPVQVGLRGFYLGIGVYVGAIFFSLMLSTWKGGSKWLLFIASGILACFEGALAIVTPENERKIVGLGAVAGIGLGGLIVPSATVAMIAAPDALITTCAALSLSVRAVGGSIGYSVYFNIFANKLTARLPLYVAQHAITAGLNPANARAFVGTFLTTPEAVGNITGVTPDIVDAATKGAQWAYAESLRYIWLTSIAFGVLAMTCALFIPNTKKFQTNRIAVAI